MSNTVLQIRGVSKNFGALEASKNITLDVRADEIHALIGPNGAGKSTLIQQIAGGLQPDRGQILFMDQDLTSLSTAARARKGMARTFQISSLAMEYTVLQNAVLGALGARGDVYRFFRPVMKEQKLLVTAQEMLALLGLGDVQNTITSELSHGQRRQLEVAVALTSSPKLFLMDEPMAGLGAEASKKLMTFLAELKKQAPILLVEHDMDAVFALADRISVLVNGEIIATGTVEEIRSNAAVRLAYLGEEAEE